MSVIFKIYKSTTLVKMFTIFKFADAMKLAGVVAKQEEKKRLQDYQTKFAWLVWRPAHDFECWRIQHSSH